MFEGSVQSGFLPPKHATMDHNQSRTDPNIEDFTLPHRFHVELDYFFFGGSPAKFLSRIHLESSWSPVVVHLGTQGDMNSPSKTPYGVHMDQLHLIVLCHLLYNQKKCKGKN